MISKELVRNIEGAHGEAGREWLANLPKLVTELSERWALKLGNAFENLSYNLVIPGTDHSGQMIVLKLGPPCAELTSEAAALKLFDGRGAVRLLDDDVARGALLLKRVSPGIPLHQLHNGTAATKTAARLMRQLWREPPTAHSFPSLSRWFKSLSELKTHPFPIDLVDEARETFAGLQTSSPPPVIMHGDLHHENILSSDDVGWLAIDPKGVCGEPGYEVGAFMLNQLPGKATQSALRELLSRRISVFSEELQIEKERLARWAFCHGMLSAAWTFEEGRYYERTIFLARSLKSLM